MVERTRGDGESHPIQPRERKMYEAEYKQAADLFQRSLTEYTKSDNMYQKAEFKKVMQEALSILNDTAAELRRKDLLQQNDKIAQDYSTFQADDKNSPKALQSDLARAKKLI